MSNFKISKLLLQQTNIDLSGKMFKGSNAQKFHNFESNCLIRSAMKKLYLCFKANLNSKIVFKEHI